MLSIPWAVFFLRGGGVFRVASKRGKFWFPTNWFGTPLILKVVEKSSKAENTLRKKRQSPVFQFFHDVTF